MAGLREELDVAIEFDDWLITWYESRIINFMDDRGEFTEHGTFISPTLIQATMRRYMELLEKRYDIDRELQGEVKRNRE